MPTSNPFLTLGLAVAAAALVSGCGGGSCQKCESGAAPAPVVQTEPLPPKVPEAVQGQLSLQGLGMTSAQWPTTDTALAFEVMDTGPDDVMLDLGYVRVLTQRQYITYSTMAKPGAAAGSPPDLSAAHISQGTYYYPVSKTSHAFGPAEGAGGLLATLTLAVKPTAAAGTWDCSPVSTALMPPVSPKHGGMALSGSARLTMNVRTTALFPGAPPGLTTTVATYDWAPSFTAEVGGEGIAITYKLEGQLMNGGALGEPMPPGQPELRQQVQVGERTDSNTRRLTYGVAYIPNNSQSLNARYATFEMECVAVGAAKPVPYDAVGQTVVVKARNPNGYEVPDTP